MRRMIMYMHNHTAFSSDVDTSDCTTSLVVLDKRHKINFVCVQQGVAIET